MKKRSPYLLYVCAGAQTGAYNIPVDEIIYIRAEDTMTTVVTGKGQHRLRIPLHELFALLDPEIFRQVHRTTVVNLARIETVRLEDRDRLVVSFKGWDECITVGHPFCQQFMRH